MPPRSKKKLRGRSKQKMLVTSRLMAISLQVDDYIYKNKSISLIEAIKYNEEIASLRLKCERDTRTLQVVEKLKILMKNIIKEQSIDIFRDNSSGFTKTCVNNDHITANLISEDIENNFTNNLEHITEELFGNVENQNSGTNKTKQDINKQRIISIDITNPVKEGNNSGVKDLSNDTITPNNSILKLNDKSEENVGYVSKNIDIDKDELVANANEKEHIDRDLVVFTPTKLQIQPDEVEITQEKKCPSQDIEKPNDITAGRNKEKQTKANKKTLVKIRNTAIKKTIKKPKKIYINNSNKELENKPSRVKKIKTKSKEKSQMDLSWVENLKYVREVSKDEHTDIQIDDNFWGNLTLPGSWNTDDFD